MLDIDSRGELLLFLFPWLYFRKFEFLSCFIPLKAAFSPNSFLINSKWNAAGCCRGFVFGFLLAITSRCNRVCVREQENASSFVVQQRDVFGSKRIQVHCAFAVRGAAGASFFL